MKSWLLLLAYITSIIGSESAPKCIFAKVPSIRSSFCLYSDGLFYESEPSGCVGQTFSWGHWERTGDTILLSYSADNIFHYNILKSTDSQSIFQVIKVVDCYNQPVRFAGVTVGTTSANLYNRGLLKILKHSAVSYAAPFFDGIDDPQNFITSRADTITYKWQCNRESIESVSGGSLYPYNMIRHTRALIKGREILFLPM